MKFKSNIAFLIFLLFLMLFMLITSVYIYSSKKTINKLSTYAHILDTKNNNTLTTGLLFDITKKYAQQAAQLLTIGKIKVNSMGEFIYEHLSNSGSVRQNAKNQIKFSNSEKTDVLIDASTKNNTLMYYWGKESKVPSHIINQLASLRQHIDFFRLIYDTTPVFAEAIYLISKEGFTFDYPILDRYANIDRMKEFYQKDYPFHMYPKTLKNKDQHVSKPKVRGPYSDFSGKPLVDVSSGIYDNGELIAYTGMVIDYEKISGKMLSWKLFLNKKNKIESFGFLLGNDMNIIAFPAKYADLFSLNKMYKDFSVNYKNPNIKLSSSNDLSIRSLEKTIILNKSGVEEIILNNEDYIITYHHIKESGWTYSNVVKKADIMSSLTPTVKLINSNVHELFSSYLWFILIFLGICFLFFFLIFRFFVNKPITRIINEVRKVGAGNFDINLDEKGLKEIVELSSTFNYMGSQLNKYIENLKNETKIRLAFETEIKIAENIQKSILQDYKSLPTFGKFEIATKLNAAQNVSGDFYDFFYIKDNLLGMVIADVSGKGLPAAFFMSMSKVLIKSQCLNNPINPGDVLTKVNHLLCLDNKAQMFVTVALGFYNIDNGTVMYSNAGHNQALFIQKNGIRKTKKFKKNMALGIIDGLDYKHGKDKLDVGETILNYTDGVSEAVSPDGEEYGEERLKNFILENNSLSIDKLSDKIIDDVTRFEKNTRFDDITLGLLKRLK